MDKNFEALRDWAITNVKNKDMIHKNLKNIKEEKNGFLAEYDNKICEFIIRPYLDQMAWLKNGFLSVVAFNSMENLNFIINKWDELVKYEKLSIYFVNLRNNEKWILHPFTHNKVCSIKKLKNGLITLFNSAGEYKGSTDRT